MNKKAIAGSTIAAAALAIGYLWYKIRKGSKKEEPKTEEAKPVVEKPAEEQAKQ
jgi:hypothetical protein